MTTTSVAGPEPAMTGSPRSRWAPMPALMISVTLVILDFFIVNVALADIQRQLAVDSGTVEWLVAGYGLTFATFLIAGGRLADRVGRRRVLAIGITLFGVASLLCGVASTAEVLIVARLLQGVGGALVSPTVITIIGTIYGPADRRRALGVYGVVMGLAAVCGQLIGGALIDLDVLGLGWRSIFLINLPLAALVLALLPRTVPESTSPDRRPVDLIGLTAVGVGLTALMLPLVEGRQQGWPLWSWLSLAAAVLIGSGAVIQQRRAAARGGSPLFEPAAFAARSVRVGLVCMIIYVANQAPFYLFLALYLQQGRGMTPIESGLTFGMLAVGYLASSLRAPQLLHRYGRRMLLVAVALLLTGYGVLGWQLIGHGNSGSLYSLLPGLLLVGLGQGIALNSLTPLVVSGADPAHVGTVSGVLATVQQVGSAVGVAVLGVLFFGLSGRGLGAALAAVVVVLGILMALVAALSRLLPTGQRNYQTR